MVSPYFRSPLTDIAGGLLTNQWNEQCRDMEMKAVDCVEAYGIDRGLRRCKDLIEDFQECAMRHKQNKRIVAMRLERQRQYWTGERSKEEHYAKSPHPDIY